jgi:hypothetical protein
MAIDKKILEEIKRYKSINNYILEQDAGELPPLPEDPLAAGLPPADAGAIPPADAGAIPPPPAPPAETAPQPVDVASDPDVEEIGAEEDDTEEVEITDLVNTQKNVEEKQQEYFDNLFNQLKNMEEKLGEMDNIMNALNTLEAKVEKYRPKTSQEKMELRSLDSGPFNQKLSDYFEDKEEDFEKQGREEYILTTDEVEDFSPKEIKNTFDTYDDEDLMP